MLMQVVNVVSKCVSWLRNDGRRETVIVRSLSFLRRSIAYINVVALSWRCIVDRTTLSHVVVITNRDS